MSKLITITEEDAGYRQGLGQLLMDVGAVPIVFEVADDFDLDAYEGLAPYQPTAQVAQSFSAKFPEVKAWLDAYKGNFDFYLSLKRQLQDKGTLSEKQIACIQRAIANDQARGVATPDAPKQEFSIKPGTVVVISKFIANRIAAEAGYARAHRAFEILEVEGETAKAYRAKVRFSAKRTSHCGVCGLVLENAVSIAAGIGPICADKLGIPHGEGSLGALESVLPTVEMMVWIPKKSIKERSDEPVSAEPQVEYTDEKRERDNRLALQHVSDPQWLDKE